MKSNEFSVLGVMSGTSLDGIDLLHVRFWLDKEWSYELGVCNTVSYDEHWKHVLKEGVNLDAAGLQELNASYTEYLGGVIRNFIAKNNIEKPDAICSHGHTILHQPNKGYTLQIGNLPEIAAYAGFPVVCDFRVQDVELGGQGAPLVPVGDALLFSDYSHCLNLGGFANVSFEEKGRRVAFDICAVNTVINHYAAKLGYEFDEGGTLARTGKICLELLEKLEALDFYKKEYPKSLGIEWVNAHIFPLTDKYELKPEDILRTYYEHIATRISEIAGEGSRVLVTGGGAYNQFLIEEIKGKTKADYIVPEAAIVEFKEALIFGFLGVLKLRGEVNCLKEVTGAIRDHSSGKIYFP